MSDNEVSRWSARERDALNEVLREYSKFKEEQQVQMAVLKTKVAIMSGFFGFLGGLAVALAKLLIH